jgi:hypothetical protein
VDSLRDLAGRLDQAAETLAASAHEVARTGPAYAAFGADAPGWPGELGRALHDQWVAATGARAREAAIVAAHLTDAAATVRVVARAYVDVDDGARRRSSGEA